MAGTTKATLAADSWTLMATGPAHPIINFEGNDEIYAYIGTAAPLIGETNIALLRHSYEPRDFGAVPTNSKMWLRATSGSAKVSVMDAGAAETAVLSVAAIVAGENHLGQVGGHITIATATFVRPADTSIYAIGDMILDATSAATVNANVTVDTAGIMRLHVGRAADKTGMVRRLRLKTDDTAFAGATIRAHLYKDRPTVNTTGDNGAFSTTESNYIGYSDIVLDRHFSNFEKGFGIPQVGNEWNFEPSAGTDYIHAILETRTIVTPGSAKTWTLAAEAHQN